MTVANNVNAFNEMLQGVIKGHSELSASSSERMDTFDHRGAGRAPVSGNKAANINIYMSLNNAVGGTGGTKGGA